MDFLYFWRFIFVRIGSKSSSFLIIVSILIFHTRFFTLVESCVMSGIFVIMVSFWLMFSFSYIHVVFLFFLVRFLYIFYFIFKMLYKGIYERINFHRLLTRLNHGKVDSHYILNFPENSQNRSNLILMGRKYNIKFNTPIVVTVIPNFQTIINLISKVVSHSMLKYRWINLLCRFLIWTRSMK